MCVKSCLQCGFKFDCMKASAMAMRMLSNGIAYAKGLEFFELKAASCDAFTGLKIKRKKETQFKFKF